MYNSYPNSYPNGQPLLSSNPAVNVLKTVGSSTQFLIATILYTVNVVVSVIAGFIAPAGSAVYLNSLYEAMGLEGSEAIDLAAESAGAGSMVGIVGGSITAILTAVALWLIWVACRNTQTGGVSTTGITILKVLARIMQVLFIVLAVIVAVALILFALGFASVGPELIGSLDGMEEYGVSAAMGSGIAMGVLIVAAIILAAVFALVIAYYICAVRVTDRVRNVANTGVADNRIPGFFVVMNWIFAVLNILDGLATLATSPLAGIGSVLGGVFFILINLCLNRYKSDMSAVMYPPVQPVYGGQQPPYQNGGN